MSEVDGNDKGRDVFSSSQGQVVATHQAYAEMRRDPRAGGGREPDTEVSPRTRCPPVGQGVDL